jgi:hypothetical protein
VILPDPAPDGEIYLTTTQAAEWCGLTKGRIVQWRMAGMLEPIPGCPPRKPFYHLADVIRAELFYQGGRCKRGQREMT